jgi:succinyl-diaminopimelate desuccinylase
MNRGLVDLFADDEAIMLADLAQLTPEPAALGSLLYGLGYDLRRFGDGLYAAGNLPHADSPVILFQLYTRSGLAVRKRQLVGKHICLSGTLAAGLAALRSLDRRPPLLFLTRRQPPPEGIRLEQIISLEGGVVPRIWRNCFGRFDALVRIIGKQSHPGMPNTAVNAIEAAVPVLQALLHLKADIKLRAAQHGVFSDAPLQPRLTISAAHGGSHGSALPTVLDILVSRRYDPAESVDAALEEIKSVVLGAASRSVRVDVSMTENDSPVPDPDAPNRTREERALATGWGWPQVAFCSSSLLMPGAVILGGLERPEHDPESDEASTTLDEMAALSRTLRALLLVS